MAIAHLSVKPAGRMSAMEKLGYITRQGQFAARLEAGEKLEAVGAGNLPAWASDDAAKFWRAADLGEVARKGSRAQVYREWEIALPREMTPDQRRALVEAFIAQEFGQPGRQCPYSYAIHNPPAADGQEQPHVHVIFSERALDGKDRTPETYFNNAKRKIGGGARKINQGLSGGERKKMLRELRLRWGDACNSALERAGSEARIDMRSLAERGERRRPEPKQGPKRWNSRGGRALVLDLRAARAAFDGARDTLRQLMPDGPRAEIAKLLGADKQATRGVFDKMPMEKLRAYAAKAPIPLQQQIDGDPKLRELREAARSASMRLRDLVRFKAAALETKERAEKLEADYRAANGWRAGLHDRGVQSVKVLADAQREQQEAAQRLAELSPQIDAQQAEADATRIAATERHAELVATLAEPANEAARKHAQAVATLRRREALAELVGEIAEAARGGAPIENPEAARLVERMREAQALGTGKEAEERKAIESAFADKPEAVASLREALGIERGHERQR